MKATDRTSRLSVSALHAVARSGLAAKAFELGFLPLIFVLSVPAYLHTWPASLLRRQLLLLLLLSLLLLILLLTFATTNTATTTLLF